MEATLGALLTWRLDRGKTRGKYFQLSHRLDIGIWRLESKYKTRCFEAWLTFQLIPLSWETVTPLLRSEHRKCQPQFVILLRAVGRLRTCTLLFLNAILTGKNWFISMIHYQAHMYPQLEVMWKLDWSNATADGSVIYSSGEKGVHSRPWDTIATHQASKNLTKACHMRIKTQDKYKMFQKKIPLKTMHTGKY